MRAPRTSALVLVPIALSALASNANADFVGWTASARSVGGGFLVNVFAVTNSATDRLFNVYGSNPKSPNAGYITTTSAGGFLQGAGTQSVFLSEEFQSSSTLDSFLTVGAYWDPTSSSWLADNATVGDPVWNVTYTAANGNLRTANSFNVRSGSPPLHTAFVNPNTHSVPATAGWFLTGAAAGAWDLSVLPNRVASSNAAAAAGTHGMMVAQLYVAQLNLDWKMGATIGRANGSVSQGTYTLQIVPAPGALALLGVAGLASGPRRRR